VAQPSVTGKAERPRRRMDVLSLLTALLVLLVGVPATQVVGPLGAAGTPSVLFGVGCLLWWGIGRLDRRFGLVRGRQPMRIVVGIFVAAMLASYAVGMMRVTLPLEMRSADRAVLRLLGAVGILLISADGLRSRADLDRLLRRVSVAGGFLAGVGILQFVAAIEVNEYLKIPGLSDHLPPQLIHQRSIFRRVPGTTTHPIEFGVTLAIILPVALHCALTAAERRGRYWLCTLAMAAAVPMSLSRAAMLGVGIAWAFQIVAWDWRRRINALIITPFALIAMRLAVPGLLGTIKSLFTSFSQDPSIAGRTEDYDYVIRFIAERPWLGRGFGTFVPEIYTTLDNQYLGQVVETGYVGLAALLLLLGSGVVLAWRVTRRAADAEQRSLGIALTAAAMVPVVTFVTFDGLAFSVVTGFTFLVLGCVGSATRLYPLAQGRRDPTTTPPARDVAGGAPDRSWRDRALRPPGADRREGAIHEARSGSVTVPGRHWPSARDTVMHARGARLLAEWRVS
jgi:polysaccharide biosynthesis protein PslJ